MGNCGKTKEKKIKIMIDTSYFIAHADELEFKESNYCMMGFELVEISKLASDGNENAITALSKCCEAIQEGKIKLLQGEKDEWMCETPNNYKNRDRGIVSKCCYLIILKGYKVKILTESKTLVALANLQNIGIKSKELRRKI